MLKTLRYLRQSEQRKRYIKFGGSEKGVSPFSGFCILFAAKKYACGAIASLRKALRLIRRFTYRKILPLRLGYFAVDNKDTVPAKPVFNQAVDLKDGFKKKQ